MRDEKLTTEGGVVDFDVITELGFADRDAFLAWMTKLSGPGAGELVAADEARFLESIADAGLCRRGICDGWCSCRGRIIGR